jgi:hypothetical protein
MALLYARIPNGRVPRVDTRFSPHNDLSILDHIKKDPYGGGAYSQPIDEYLVVGYWSLRLLFMSIGILGVGSSLILFAIVLFAIVFLGGWGADLMPSVQVAGILMLFGLPVLIYWIKRPYRRFLVFDPARGLVHVPRFWGGVDRVRFQDLDFVIMDSPNLTGSNVGSMIYMVCPGKPLESAMGDLRKMMQFFLKHRFNMIFLEQGPSDEDAPRYWQFIVELMGGKLEYPIDLFMARRMKTLPTTSWSFIEIWRPKFRYFDPDALGDDITWWKDEDGRWWRTEERPEPEARRQAAEAALAPVREKIAERRAQIKQWRTFEKHSIRGDLLEDYLADVAGNMSRGEVRKLRRLWEQHVPPQERVGGLGIPPRDFDEALPVIKALLADYPDVAEGRWWRSYDAEQEAIRYHIALAQFRGVGHDSEALSKARQAVEAALPPHIRSDVDVKIADEPERSLFYRRAISDQRRVASSA